MAGAALGLTGMESRVAVLLAEGMSVRQIAAATGRKESTIRSHVKHIFVKHGLSRQAELVRRSGGPTLKAEEATGADLVSLALSS